MLSDSNRPGRTLEKLIAFLEKMLSRAEGAVIESPFYVRDKITGEVREHDVVVRGNFGHHETLIALECRDKSRPVTVNEVESFQSKCNDTGIHGKVIVAVKGFTKGAMKKAEAYGIRCLSLDEALGFPWMEMKTIAQFSRNITRNSWRFILADDPKHDIKNFVIRNSDGTELRTVDFENSTREELNKLEECCCFLPGKHRQKFHFILTGQSLYDMDRHQVVELSHADVLVEWEIVKEDKPVFQWQYRDQLSQKVLGEVAIAPMDLGSIKGALTFVNGGNGISVNFHIGELLKTGYAGKAISQSPSLPTKSEKQLGTDGLSG